MDIGKGNWKRNLFLRAWERCRSLGSGNKKSARNIRNSLTKSKSWHRTKRSSEGDNEKRKKKCHVAPYGCFSVYVGPEKQRFVIKTEFANHPLFKLLLDDAELEYGFNSEGPILLPCDVDLFYKVLAEMDCGEEMSIPSWSPLNLCSPCRRSINIGYGGYRPVHRARMLKMNRI
ncbi:hypothetical protein P3X46_023547 [Hevea brasiliensis]|uniref:SAUR family protein n=1 Tax=Hevea brasiliensis TaxID=3981 RepID=A0ABQ9LBA8_HEVBR|nr:auxin-responsive protein SAUR72-like [Hevea brasiliensis]KAJ9163925.1 hypothetical protein P3X46_023547 [Hevea brasiliensis]